jgi:hypothetical protein
MTTEITNWINRNVENGFIGKSNYLTIENVVVRIANHAPRKYNFKAYNEDCDKIILVFFASDVNESEIQDIINNELYDYDCEYIIIEENKLSDYDEVVISRFVS